jgi:multiple sugar transport system permease protein
MDGRTIRRMGTYSLVSIVVVIALFPLYWLITTSMLTDNALFVLPPRFFPNESLLRNYLLYLRSNPFLLWLRNSMLTCGSATVASTFIALFGAYSLSRFVFRGRVLLVFLILLTQMLPSVLLVIPIFILFSGLQLNNSLVGLALVYTCVTLPIGLWFLKGFFDAIPVELQDAARIDGCTQIGVLFRIAIPLIVPGIMATATWSFIVGWDEFVFAYSMISTDSLWPVSVGLASHIGQYGISWSKIMSGAVLATVPIGILFMFFQRQLVSGLTAGAVKA